MSGEYRGDYQELVDEISALLGVPATLENRDFELIVFGAYDSEGDLDPSALDPVRTRSILTRRSTTAVRTWFEGFGIAHATGPVRIPPSPEAGVYRGRVCLPVRHRDLVLGYVWLLADDVHRDFQALAREVLDDRDDLVDGLAGDEAVDDRLGHRGCRDQTAHLFAARGGENHGTQHGAPPQRSQQEAGSRRFGYGTENHRET